MSHMGLRKALNIKIRQVHHQENLLHKAIKAFLTPRNLRRNQFMTFMAAKNQNQKKNKKLIPVIGRSISRLQKKKKAVMMKRN